MKCRGWVMLLLLFLAILSMGGSFTCAFSSGDNHFITTHPN